MDLTTYATVDATGATTVVIVNKDVSTDAEVRIAAGRKPGRARVMRLTAPSLDSRTEVKLGGAAVGPDGRWHGRYESAPVTDGMCRVDVPAGSAAIVRMAT
jgi:hypothetical protein